MKDIHDVNFSIFVIDKRTSDSSKKIASEFSDNVIDQEETIGKGAAVRQAIEEWKKNPTQMIVFLDADGSYSFASVNKILETLEGGADLASGSRFLSVKGRPEGMSRLHNFGNRILSIISSVRNRRRISDLCTGLWGFNSQSLMKINLSSRGFDLEAELAGMARKQGLEHIEVQVDWSQRKGGPANCGH